MRHLRTYCFLSFPLLALWLPVVARSQGTANDYERAGKLRQRTQNKVFKSEIKPHWFAENARFWYRNDLPDGGKEFIVVDVNEGERRLAFDHQRLAKSLSEVLKSEFKPSLLPMDHIQFAADGKSLLFRAKDKGWSCDLETYEVKEAEVSEPKKDERENRSNRRRRRGEGAPRRESPDGKWEAFVKDHQLFVRDKASSEAFVLGDDGTEEDGYQERFYWSPDSTKLVAIRRKRGDDRKVYLIESSPKDQLQPKLQSYDYLKPGDDIALSKPQLFDVVDRTHIPVSDQLFENPWRISEVRWQNDSRRFTFLYNQRGHQLLRIVAVDGQTGEAGTILNEESKTFIDYAYKQFMHYVADSNELIWMSERDGWNHLYLYDGISGSVKNQITRGPWVVRGVDRVDDEKREIWFRASGVYPEQDPYYIHYCRVNFDGTGFLVLTAGNGTHQIQASPDRKYFVDTYSRVDMPPVHELRRSEDGLLMCTLERADISALLATGWKMPERFVAKGRDGETDIYGVIWRPTNFDPACKYPVIEDIYAGPHGSFVPKSFSVYSKRMSLAELGFVVVKVDGMGTSNRSKAFHDVSWKNVGDSGFPDRILWIKAVAKKYPHADITRVGIYGGSAGGQSSTRALLAHGEFYHVAVSDCGCHDNRMDKIWWNELWMGWPLGDHYKEQSNVTQAHRLEGKLLLIVGELDRNVDPASTMQVVDALIKADKDFDMLVVPGGGHGIAESTYGTRRRRDFFVRHLLKAEPRRQTVDNKEQKETKEE